MKKDIHNRNDIIRLVDAFYDKIKTDQVIGFIFNDIAQVNWEDHLPKMYDFWDNVLFFTGNFDGNPMQKHKELHNKCPLTHAHYIRNMVNVTVSWQNINVMSPIEH